MSKTLIGNIKGPKGDTGEKGATGDKGATGATGTRGSRWSEGTAITGTSTTAAVFSGTGITDALVNDYYLNTSTGNVYRCTISGNASTAKWVYVANIKGKAGEAPTDGTNMTAAFVQASSRANIATGETHGTIFGKIKKWFADLTAAAFAQMISSYSDLMSNTVSGYLPDAVAVKEGFESLNGSLNNKTNKDNFDGDTESSFIKANTYAYVVNRDNTLFMPMKAGKFETPDGVVALKSELNWKLLGSVTGTTTVNLSSIDFKELLIVTTATKSNNMTLVIPKTVLKTSLQVFSVSQYVTANDNGFANFAVTLTSLYLYKAYVNSGTEVTATTSVSVYYR